ncbi:MAG: DNA/RNA nuclease SfsA [Candidatus Methanomethylophilaceae archaeon]
MHYGDVIGATFVARPNRFIALVQIGDRLEKVHVRNTGRCKEILIPGTRVILVESDNPERKTRYDLIAAYKGDILINIDTMAPNKVFQEFIPVSGLFGDSPIVHPERKYGDSRFDFYIDMGTKEAFVEVKGVTLESDGVCRFPDAPTERGLKHVFGLMDAVDDGYDAYIAFIVQMEGTEYVSPNYDTHPQFGEALKMAVDRGVKVLVFDCRVTEDSLTVDHQLPFVF